MVVNSRLDYHLSWVVNDYFGVGFLIERNKMYAHASPPGYAVVKKLPGAPSTPPILSMEFIVDTGRVARAPFPINAFIMYERLDNI